MGHRSKLFGTGFQDGKLLVAVVFGLARCAWADTPTTGSPGNSEPSVAPLVISGAQTARPGGTHSAGIAEIIKLLDAKMDTPVIVSYVQNSPIPYHPDATELIALKERGASADLLVALLNRGDEVRRQMAQAQRTANPQPATSVYGNTTAGAYPAYPDGYSDSYYPAYPSTYYYNNVYGGPLAYGPPIPIGFRPNLYSHGRLPSPRGGAPFMGAGGRRVSASPGGPPAAHAMRSFSAPMGGRAGFSPVRSGGFGGSGHPGGGHPGGGRPGGRAR